MCQTQNLQGMMQTFKVMSIIQLVLGVGLIIAGAVAASYKLPKWCNESSSFECEEDYDEADRFTKTLALWGTLPGIVPVVFGIVGIVAAMKQSKALVGVMLAFTIVGTILCIIGVFLPYIGAAIFTVICNNDWDENNPDAGELRATKEGRDFCDRYTGGLWAVVAFNIILAIYQFAFSIVCCCYCCTNEQVWQQANGGAPPGVPMQPMGAPAMPAQVPMQPVPGQPVPAYGQPPVQQHIPEAEPVKY